MNGAAPGKLQMATLSLAGRLQLHAVCICKITAHGCYACALNQRAHVLWLGIKCKEVSVPLPVMHDPQTCLGWKIQEQLLPVGASEAVPSVAGPSGASGGAAPAGASAGPAPAPGAAASAPAVAAAAAPLASYPPARATHEEVLADRERFNATWREALAALGINLDKVSWAALPLQGAMPVGCL